MKKNELLALCRYYREEPRCPFDDETRLASCLFWDFEKMFVQNCLRDQSFLESYLSRVDDYKAAHPRVVNDLTSDRFAKGTKAIILYCEDMLRKWCPARVDLIFKYGNE